MIHHLLLRKESPVGSKPRLHRMVECNAHNSVLWKCSKEEFFSDILLLKSFVLTRQQLLPTNLAETLSHANIDRHIYKRDPEVQYAHCSGYRVLSHVWNQGLAARKWLTRDSWAVSTTSRKCKGGHSAIKPRVFWAPPRFIIYPLLKVLNGSCATPEDHSSK